MYDRQVATTVINQILQSVATIRQRFEPVPDSSFFLTSHAGMEKLDAICMQLIAIGESLKNLDKITAGQLLARYPAID